MADFELVTYEGARFWKVNVGTPGPIVGTSGPLYQYTVYVQKGLSFHRERLAKRIDSTLADKRSWIRGPVRFQRVAEGAGTDILVARSDTVDVLCAPLQTNGEVSCCQGRKVVLNAVRWKYAVPHWPGSLTSYRQMLINHEMGHRIGKGHKWCPGPEQPAPVMQQQTYGLQGCKANPWPLDYEVGLSIAPVMHEDGFAE